MCRMVICMRAASRGNKYRIEANTDTPVQPIIQVVPSTLLGSILVFHI